MKDFCGDIASLKADIDLEHHWIERIERQMMMQFHVCRNLKILNGELAIQLGWHVLC